MDWCSTMGKSVTGYEPCEHVWALLDRSLFKKCVRPASNYELLKLWHSTQIEIPKLKIAELDAFMPNRGKMLKGTKQELTKH